jgi:hypothetical protein
MASGFAGDSPFKLEQPRFPVPIAGESTDRSANIDDAMIGKMAFARTGFVGS